MVMLYYALSKHWHLECLNFQLSKWAFGMVMSSGVVLHLQYWLLDSYRPL